MNGSDGRGVGVGRGVVDTRSSFDNIVQQMSQQVLLMGKIWLKQEERSSRHHSERYNVMLDEFKASTAAWEATISTAAVVATAKVATAKAKVEVALEDVVKGVEEEEAAEMATMKMVRGVKEEEAVETAIINALKNVEEEETMVEAAVEETAKDVEASEGAMVEVVVKESVKDVEMLGAMEDMVRGVEEEEAAEMATMKTVRGVEEEEAAEMATMKTVRGVEEENATEAALEGALRNMEEEEATVGAMGEVAVEETVKNVEVLEATDEAAVEDEPATEGAMEDEAVKDVVEDGEAVKDVVEDGKAVKDVEGDEAVEDVEEDEAVKDVEEDEAVEDVEKDEAVNDVEEDASLRGKSVDLVQMVDVAADVVGMQEAARMSTQTVVQCGGCGHAEEEGGSTRTRWKSWRRARWKRSFLEVTWGTTSCSGGATCVRSGRVLASSEGLVQFERTRLLAGEIATNAHVRTACALRQQGM